MSADGELYVNETCRDEFGEELDNWFGKGEWELNVSPFMDCWDMAQFPAVIEVEVIDEDNNKIGKVEITNEFVIEGGYERYIECYPKSIKLLENR